MKKFKLPVIVLITGVAIYCVFRFYRKDSSGKEDTSRYYTDPDIDQVGWGYYGA